MQICGHLRCRLTKNSPRRTISTPAGVSCTLLASTHIFSKGLRKGYCQRGSFKRCGHLRCRIVSERTRMSVVPYISDVFALQKLAASKCAWTYICWQGIYPRLFLKGLRKKRFRTDRDVHSLACFRFIFARAVYLYRLFQKADEEFILRYVAVKKRTSVYAFYRPVANFCSEKFL